jgi:signal transduction histidine kinase/ligand-binding sensor domain-containing protein
VLATKPLLILFLVAATPLKALDPHATIRDLVHTKWSGGETPFSAVHGLAQTRDGALWLATTQGLFRFDGVRFSRMDALSQTSIRNLLATRDGSLWVVFNSGTVSRLFAGNITTFSAQELPKANMLTEDRGGSLLAATANGGLARFRNGRWQEIARALHHLAKRSHYVWFDREGFLWLETEDRLLELPVGADRFTDPGIPVRPTIVVRQPMAQAPDGTIWFADADSVRSVSPNRAHIEVKVEVNAVMVDRQGPIWLGSFGDGLWRVPVPTPDGKKIVISGDPEVEKFTMKEGLSGNQVNCVMEDREGDIWVGTDLGLDRFRNSVFHRVNFPDADRIASMWDSSSDGGIVIQTAAPPTKLEHIAADGNIAVLSVPGPNVTVCYEEDGTVWVGTAAGVGKWTGRGISYYLRLRNAAVERLGCGYGDIWIASPTEGVMRFSSEKLMSMPQLRSNVSGFYPMGPGAVWIAYPDGRVSVYDNGAIREYGNKDGVPEGAIVDIVGKPGGELWLASERGLARFKGNHFQSVDLVPGLQLEGVRPGESGFLWIRAGKELIRMAIREFDRAVANPGYKPRFERYGSLDGIPGVIKMGAVSPHRNWLATSEGLGYLNIDTPKNTVPPPVQIEALIADGKTIPASQGIVVPKLTHNLQIDYTAFSLTIPERVQFRYKLEGVDKEWQDRGTRRQAYYTDLAPKKYRFLVKACNNDGVWNEQGAALDFSVDPAYYQTHWFQAGDVAIFLVSLWGLYQLRLRQIARQFSGRLEERIAERTRIARELHDTLLQSFQGSLFEFQAAQKLLSRRPEEASRTLDQAIRSAKAAISEGRDAIHELREGSASRGDLAQLLRAAGHECSEAQVLNDGSAAFHVSVEGPPQDLSPVLQDELYRIGRELLRNAFSHARAKVIEVEIRYSHKELSLRVRDDGIGIEANLIHAGARPGHWGLHGVRERATLASAKLEIWSQAGAGTEVQISVPASIAYLRPLKLRSFRLFERKT